MPGVMGPCVRRDDVLRFFPSTLVVPASRTHNNRILWLCHENSQCRDVGDWLGLTERSLIDAWGYGSLRAQGRRAEIFSVNSRRPCGRRDDVQRVPPCYPPAFSAGPRRTSSDSEEDTEGTCSPSDALATATRVLLKTVSAASCCVSRLFSSSPISTE